MLRCVCGGGGIKKENIVQKNIISMNHFSFKHLSIQLCERDVKTYKQYDWQMIAILLIQTNCYIFSESS